MLDYSKVTTQQRDAVKVLIETRSAEAAAESAGVSVDTVLEWEADRAIFNAAGQVFFRDSLAKILEQRERGWWPVQRQQPEPEPDPVVPDPYEPDYPVRHRMVWTRGYPYSRDGTPPPQPDY